MKSRPNWTILAAMLGFGLSGCGVTEIQSHAGTDPIPPFQHMLVVSAADDDNANPVFPQLIDAGFHNAAAKCGLTIDFVFDHLDKQPVQRRSAARAGMELAVTPNIVFDTKTQSHTFASRFGYVATLTDRSRQLELWKASFGVRPFSTQTSGSAAKLATQIPDAIFARMAQDGVLHGCP